MLATIKRICIANQRYFQTRRASSSVISKDASNFRNLALVAHIDSGKTTLTESILHTSSFLAAPGSVDTGSTTTDFLPAERERGITIQSASIPVSWKDWTFNLVDTPGHADFGMEVESASRVVDGAVVLIDSVEGVEAQTKGVWKQLDRYGVATRLLFLNKLDRPGASLRSSYLSVLAHRLHPEPTLLALPIASFAAEDYQTAEPGVVGLVDLVKWEVWKWEGGVHSRHPLPKSVEELYSTPVFPPSHPLVKELLPARISLLERLGMHSEPLMETMLSLEGPDDYLSLASSEIMPHIRNLTLSNAILPVLCGAAAQHIGTELVLDYVGELLASPLDVSRSSNKPSTGQTQALVWKVAWDKQKGWMSFVRVYSGTLKLRGSLHNTTNKQKEKVTKLLLLYADQTEEVDSLPTGSVGVVLGLKHTRTGDTLSSSSSHGESPMMGIVPPPAVISVAVTPSSQSDQGLVSDALQSLSRTDPSVRVENVEGQLLVHGLGSLHLEIVEGRLRDEWGARFEFGRRRVSYRESFSHDSFDFEREWETHMQGKTASANIGLTIRRLDTSLGEAGEEAWGGNKVVLATALNKLAKLEKVIPLNPSSEGANAVSPEANLAQGLLNTLSNSPNTSLPLSGLHITIQKYSISPHAPSFVLAGAGSYILREALKAADMGPIMEPYVRLKVDVPEAYVGKVAKDVTEHGGEIQDMTESAEGHDADGVPYDSDSLYVPPEWLTPCSSSSNAVSSATRQVKRSIYAYAPLSQMLDYSQRLRAISGGHGIFDMTSTGFREVGEVRATEILKEIGRA
ncbi:P-loop containing nucleoside triphosphate hydrolase protein [Sistotremastrum niveocremeum HHB9708]|uniref:p-loop containing nucleoside triphosphate hydrolase protein n=1 Tax=Sistotremastrum niveocremeum HHB9708 TaxID=1314777 RepID=A0A164ZEM4_9AGAM|nr:P-loop containing nucleoside triphosphate hydrolase protein [Sistotremastrum niveocremeum HHB9708]